MQAGSILGRGGCSGRHGLGFGAGTPGLQEVRLALPLVVPVSRGAGHAGSSNNRGGGDTSSAGDGSCCFEELTLACSGALVVRNSRALARATRAAALARSVVFEEDAPAGARGESAMVCDMAQSTEVKTGAGGASGLVGPNGHEEDSGQVVRASAALVIGTLPELWPRAEVWEVPLIMSQVDGSVEAAGSWQQRLAWGWRGSETVVMVELVCSKGWRDEAAQQLQGVLTEGAASCRWGKLKQLCG